MGFEVIYTYSCLHENSFPGSTPLHLAARAGSLDCIRELLAWGAERLQRDDLGYCFFPLFNLPGSVEESIVMKLNVFFCESTIVLFSYLSKICNVVVVVQENTIHNCFKTQTWCMCSIAESFICRASCLAIAIEIHQWAEWRGKTFARMCPDGG